MLSATRGRVTTLAAAPRQATVIVPGNRVYRDGTPSPELEQRLLTALALYRQGCARNIVVSGLTNGAYDEPRGMADWLVARGVPASDVVLDPGGHRTASTVADAVARGVRSATFVTQHYHLPRALYLAEAAGMEAVGVASRRGSSSIISLLITYTREVLARAESTLEVAWRGVRA